MKYYICRENTVVKTKDFTNFACSSEAEAVALVAALNLANTHKSDVYFLVSF